MDDARRPLLACPSNTAPPVMADGFAFVADSECSARMLAGQADDQRTKHVCAARGVNVCLKSCDQQLRGTPSQMTTCAFQQGDPARGR